MGLVGRRLSGRSEPRRRPRRGGVEVGGHGAGELAGPAVGRDVAGLLDPERATRPSPRSRRRAGPATACRAPSRTGRCRTRPWDRRAQHGRSQAPHGSKSASGPVGSSSASMKIPRQRMRGPYCGVTTRLLRPITPRPARTAASLRNAPPYSIWYGSERAPDPELFVHPRAQPLGLRRQLAVAWGEALDLRGSTSRAPARTPGAPAPRPGPTCTRPSTPRPRTRGRRGSRRRWRTRGRS